MEEEKKNKNNSKVFISKIIKEIIQLLVLAIVIIISIQFGLHIYLKYFEYKNPYDTYNGHCSRFDHDYLLQKYSPADENEAPKYYCCKKDSNGNYSRCTLIEKFSN